MLDESISVTFKKNIIVLSLFLFPQEKIWREKDKRKYKSGCIKSLYDLSLYPCSYRESK